MTDDVSLQPPQRTTLLDYAIEALRNAIVNGELKPGDRVNELSLSGKLNISRTTIREALQQLEQAGLLERIPYRGTFVTQFSEGKIQEVNQLRGVLETYAAEILVQAGKHTPQALHQLYDAIEEMRDLDPTANPAETNAVHIRFHRTLVELTGNELLLTVWNELSLQFLVAMRSSQLSGIASGRTGRFDEAHEAVVQAIVSGDMGKIRSVIRSHVS